MKGNVIKMLNNSRHFLSQMLPAHSVNTSTIWRSKTRELLKLRRYRQAFAGYLHVVTRMTEERVATSIRWTRYVAMRRTGPEQLNNSLVIWVTISRGWQVATLAQVQPTYDAVGNVATLTTTRGAIPGVAGTGDNETQAFCYDEQGRLTWAGTQGSGPCGRVGTQGLSGAGYIASYSYNSVGRLASRAVPTSGGGAWHVAEDTGMHVLEHARRIRRCNPSERET